MMQFYEMKDSGVECIGSVPTHWNISRAKYHLSKVNSGSTPKGGSESYVNDGIPLIRSQNVKNSGLDLSDVVFIPTETHEKMSNSKVNLDDVLLNITGASIGRSVFVNSIDEANVNQHVCILRAYPWLLPKYLQYILASQVGQAQIYSSFTGSGREGLNFEAIKRFNIPLPHKVEQKAIADYLDKACEKVDKTLSIKKQQLDQLEAYRASVIREAVTKGLDKNVPIKDSGIERIGHIPENWEVTKFKRITEINRGKFTHRPRNDPDYYGGDYPFIQTGDISNSNKYIRSYKQTLNDKGLSVSKMFPLGTLTMTIAANVGDVAILDFEACFPDSVLGFKPSYKVSVEYLYYLFLGLNDDILSTAIVTTQLNLNLVRVGNVQCVLPKPNEQALITDYLNNFCENIEKTKAVIESQITKLTEYRQSLIHECVTGKKRVYQGDIN